MFSPQKPNRAAAGVAPQPPASAATAAKKRKREISSLRNFREHMYSKGIPTLHAMVERNVVLMYPPAGIDAAREHLKLRAMLMGSGTDVHMLSATNHNHDDPAAAAEGLLLPPPPPAPQTPPAVGGRSTIDIDAFLSELEPPPVPSSPAVAIAAANEVGAPEGAQPSTPQHRHAAVSVGGAHGGARAAFVDPLDIEVEPALQQAVRDAGLVTVSDLANYHRQQLGSLISLLYDFNHAEFLKLPLRQTLDLLMRCGRESYAHLSEFEQHERARKRRVTDDRRRVAAAADNMERMRREGREDFFERQLEAAESRASQLHNDTAFSLVGDGGARVADGFDDNEDEVEQDQALLLRDVQSSLPEGTYSMFAVDDTDEAIMGTASAPVVATQSEIGTDVHLDEGLPTVKGEGEGRVE